MELEDLGPPTFSAHVVRYRGQLLEIKASDNQNWLPQHQLREGQAGSQEPALRKVPPAWREEAADAAGVNISYCREGAATQLAWYVATQQELRAVVPLTQPRKSAEVC
jgi:hypothetical protein